MGIESDQLVKNSTGVSPLTLRERLKKTDKNDDFNSHDDCFSGCSIFQVLHGI